MATKKNKPKCTKGTACGFGCIASGKVCNQAVPKEATAENLDAIPVKGKGGGKKAAQGDKVKVKATKAPKVDDKTAQSAFKELRREQETTGTGIVAVSAGQLKAKLKSKAKISDKEADNVYEDLKKRKKIFTVKEKDRELIYWNE